MAVFVGQTGTGKTFAAISSACLLDPSFNEDRIAFSSNEFMNLIRQDLPRGSVIVWDETGVGINARTFYDQANLAISYVTQTFRFKNYVVLFTVPSFTYIDKQVRQLFHARIKMKTFNQRRHVAYGEWRWLDYNSDTGKIYYKAPRLRFGNREHKISEVFFPHPPKHLIDTYEVRKKLAMVKLYEKYRAQVAYVKTPVGAMNTRNKVLAPAQLAIMIDKIKKRKDEFKMNNKDKLSVTKLMLEFGMGKQRALALAHDLNDELFGKNRKFNQPSFSYV